MTRDLEGRVNGHSKLARKATRPSERPAEKTKPRQQEAPPLLSKKLCKNPANIARSLPASAVRKGAWANGHKETSFVDSDEEYLPGTSATFSPLARRVATVGSKRSVNSNLRNETYDKEDDELRLPTSLNGLTRHDVPESATIAPVVTSVAEPTQSIIVDRCPPSPPPFPSLNALPWYYIYTPAVTAPEGWYLKQTQKNKRRRELSSASSCDGRRSSSMERDAHQVKKTRQNALSKRETSQSESTEEGNNETSESEDEANERFWDSSDDGMDSDDSSSLLRKEDVRFVRNLNEQGDQRSTTFPIIKIGQSRRKRYLEDILPGGVFTGAVCEAKVSPSSSSISGSEVDEHRASRSSPRYQDPSLVSEIEYV